MPKSLYDLLNGRWQIPLALAAATTAGVTLYHLVPIVPEPNLDAVLADVAVLEQAGDYEAALDAANGLLSLDPPRPAEERAQLHDRAAAVLFAQQSVLGEHDPNGLLELLEHERAATELGLAATPQRALRSAFAHLWSNQREDALKGFRRALAGELSAQERRDVIKEVVELLEGKPARAERLQLIEEVLQDESTPLPYVWWGLQRVVQQALDEHDTPRARELLVRYGPRLATSDLKGYLEYLSALVSLHEGRIGEAAPIVQWIDEWLGAEARSTPALDDFGHLPSLNRWLMGRIHLAEKRPAEALAAFERLLDFYPPRELRVSAHAGRGAALAALDRHDEAVTAFTKAAAELDDKAEPRRLENNAEHRAPQAEPQNARGAPRELIQGLVELFDERTQADDDEHALAYLELAARVTPIESEELRPLLERMGESLAAAARRSTDATAAARRHARAAESFERAAQLARFDETRRGELLWSAANEFDALGRIADLRRLLSAFMNERSDHPRMPAALLQLGRACELAGDLPAALRWYERLVQGYPELEQAARARVQWAGTLITLGESRYADAEGVLGDLLASDSVTPEAQVYRDALLMLGELLLQQGRYGEAIGRLSDFLALYPNDPEQIRLRMALADAYRNSAYALRSQARPDAIAESRVRFGEAANLYAALATELAQAGAETTKTEPYLRLAMFYRGDCLFELNEPETLQDALGAYRAAVARYENRAAALVGQVQIANVLLRLGDTGGARQAVESARWLLRRLPRDEADLSEAQHEHWERYLGLVAGAELFDELSTGVALAAPPYEE